MLDPFNGPLIGRKNVPTIRLSEYGVRLHGQVHGATGFRGLEYSSEVLSKALSEEAPACLNMALFKRPR